jgi:prepilin-type N-terminal cleavage/methylation domain-containing protein
MKKGFTLIEVCLVMMIFGVAVTSLMALFPVSLRQGNMAVADSVVTTFADAVMNALAANAASDAMRRDWATWEQEDEFAKAIGANVFIDVGDGPGTGKSLKKVGNGYEDSIDDYLGIPKSHIKYKLEFAQVTKPHDYGGRLYRATLRVTDNKTAAISSGSVFVSYFTYLGEVP